MSQPHIYRAASNRCAVDLTAMPLPVTEAVALQILAGIGFVELRVSLLVEARELIGTARYVRGAKPSEAPHTVDCSSFTKYIYARRGLWLPRRSIQQREAGQVAYLSDPRPGDLVFTTGWKNYYRDNPDDAIGHVGMITGEGTVIHAANRSLHVLEVSIDGFMREKALRGVRRYLPDSIRTFQIPPHREVESSDDIYWMILQNLAQ